MDEMEVMIMAKRILNEEQLIDVIWGATLMGGGGGGAMSNGMDLLNTYKKLHSEKDVQLTLYETNEMDENAYAAVTCGMGAPTVLKTVDFSKYAVNAFNTLKDIATQMNPPRKLEYVFPVELGGFNTFCPMLISLLEDIPLIDTDGAGRAVPALDTLLLHVNGLETSPLAMADANNNQISIKLQNPKDAPMGEEIGRWICTAFGQISGLSGWMVKKADIENSLPCGTISLCEKIGHELRECAKTGANVFDSLNHIGVECKFLTKGKVVKCENLQKKGFDYGKVYVEGNDGQWVIYFQNENLLVEHEGKAVMTVPDITCFYHAENGMPLTNADIEENMEICLGAIKAPSAWWKNPNMFEIWKPFLENVGYTGKNIPFSK